VKKRGADSVVMSIKEIFDRAKEHPPAIVFIDEIDALVPARDITDEAGALLTGEILEEFDKIKDATGIVVVASTNRPDVLDPALLRPGRFDKLIFVPPPQKADREKLFEQNLKKIPLSSNFDFGKLADLSDGFTGADIANICRQVKINALQASISKGGEAKVGMSDVTKILDKAKPSAPPSVMGRYMTFLSEYGKR
jgi:transitional endoplasmic reticulum ATPase